MSSGKENSTKHLQFGCLSRFSKKSYIDKSLIFTSYSHLNYMLTLLLYIKGFFDIFSSLIYNELLDFFSEQTDLIT